ncbi:hypothetical protein SKAU_G00191270 [Synaphobranchus kaupii]|uniref:Uncharacterized protein n=1 Tax=Synaphobranchus kaupii TaxID=118154 RepID=A0A9Q1IXB0_SYNKA|nr:hypothetical protein SKAU_G00191270 [Synaphobranchus kaupii]
MAGLTGSGRGEAAGPLTPPFPHSAPRGCGRAASGGSRGVSVSLGLSGGKGGGRRPSARPARNRPGGQEPLAHKPGGPAREGPGRAGWDIQSVRVARGVCHGAQNLGYAARFGETSSWSEQREQFAPGARNWATWPRERIAGPQRPLSYISACTHRSEGLQVSLDGVGAKMGGEVSGECRAPE